MNMGGSSLAANISDHLKGPSYDTLKKSRKKFRREVDIGVNMALMARNI